MFGRLAGVRIKAAEQAMSEGRLDEAFDLAVSRDLADNRRAKQLLEELGGKFLRRGQDRLLAKEFAAAVADFDRAVKCGCPAEQAAEWQNRAKLATIENREAAHDRATVLASARRYLAEGRLDQAAEVLAGVAERDEEAAAIKAAIAQQAEKARQLLAAAEGALNEGNLSLAARQVREARGLHANLEEIGRIETRLIEGAIKEAAEDFNSGRLVRAEQHVAALGDLGRGRSPRIDIEEALRLARECAKALAANRYARAGVVLGRLAQLGLQAEWIAEAKAHLAALDDKRKALLEGPLGPLAAGDVPSAVSAAATPENETPARPPLHPAMAGVFQDGPPPTMLGAAARPAVRDDDYEAPPRRILLRIDGGGSFLLIRGDRVTIGRAGAGATADLQLISDLSERQAEIVRAGEDYFVMSSGGVELAGRPTDYALLQDGDRLRLGRHVRLTFLRPSKKSPTAVLELGDGVRTVSDCRRVILWCGPLLLGRTRECHVRLGPAFGNAILMERGGRLHVRSTAAGGRMLPVVFGCPMELDELRVTAQAWSDQPGFGRVIG